MTPPEIAALLDKATRLETPCAAGTMVWHAFGDEAAPAVVLLHGGFGSWLHWARAIPLLLPRWRVLAPDLPGLGDSAEPASPYSPESIAAIVAGGIDALAPGRFMLAGFSFGGVVGGHVAALVGDRARGFVFFGPGGLGLKRGEHQPLLQWRHLLPDRAAIDEVNAENLRRFMIRDPARVDATSVWIQTENTLRARIRSRPWAGTDTLARKLPLVTAPKCGAWGDRDMTAYPFLDQRIALMAEVGAAYVEIPDCGHWAPYEQPQACTDLIEEWSRRSKPPA